MIFSNNRMILCIFVLLCLSICTDNSNSSAETAPMIKLYSGLSSPVGMGFDTKGNLYIAEWGAGIVTRISPSGNRIAFADGLNGPSGLAVDSKDNIYVASYSDNLVYRFTPKGKRSVFIEGLATPAGLSFDQRGNLLIANRMTDEILSVSSEGKINTVVGGLQTPVGAVQTVEGNYFVSNINGGISFITLNGDMKTISTELARPGPGIVINDYGEVFVVDYGGTTVNQVMQSGKIKLIAEGLPSPAGLTLDENGFLYVATWGDGAIYQIER